MLFHNSPLFLVILGFQALGGSSAPAQTSLNVSSISESLASCQVRIRLKPHFPRATQASRALSSHHRHPPWPVHSRFNALSHSLMRHLKIGTTLRGLRPPSHATGKSQRRRNHPRGIMALRLGTPSSFKCRKRVLSALV